MSADQYPTGTVARVRVGEWEGRALRDTAGDAWLVAGCPGVDYVIAESVTVLDVELPAPVDEPLLIGAVVEATASSRRQMFVRWSTEDPCPWMDGKGVDRSWSSLNDPDLKSPGYDPEATA